MTRIKRGVMTKKRHKKILKLAKGYRGKRKNVFRLAKVAVIKAGVHAYRNRREKKRTFRKLWIARINALLKEKGYNYSSFINKINKAGIIIDRKMLAELAMNESDVFTKIVDQVMC